MGKFIAAGALAAAILAVAGPPPALGQAGSAPAPSGSAAPTATSPSIPSAGQVLDENQIREKLKEEGYTEVTELRLQGPSYEAKATKDGRSVNLTVDARTGSIRSTY